MKYFIQSALTALGASALLVGTANAQAIPRTDSGNLVQTISLTDASGPTIDEITVSSGKSVVLRFDARISEASVGNPETADIVPLTDRSLYILGKQHGSTNLTLIGSDKQVLGIVDVTVSFDTIGLKRRLHEMFPDETIEVRTSGDTIMLGGTVSNTAVSARAMEIANTYARDHVYNGMQIGGSQQVMLAVRFAEVERNAAKSLGISTDVIVNGGPDGLVSSFITPDAVTSSSFAFIRDVIDLTQDVTIDVLLDALEQKGVASVLAEPTLIAVSGEEASFLAGGEFPIPVSTSDSNGALRVQIEFKEFGVRLAFTPTVIGDKIGLKVTPEVSELDMQNGVSLSNIIIPGLRTRRATTSVELKHGQSFAIAGLIQKEFLDDLDQLPGFGSVPILGALTRSARFKRQETELAIIVTPYLVEPVEDDSLALPTDFFTRPHELELFFLGKTEDGEQSGGINNLLAMATAPAGMRFASQHDQAAIGYIIE